MQCSELMKTKPECLGAGVTVSEAAQRMRDMNIGFLPVCDSSGVVIGTITDRDLAVRVLADGLPPNTAVGEVMTDEIVACKTTDDLEDAKELMGEHQKSRIMCLDDEGRLEGVISLSDIARDDDAGVTLRYIAARETRL